MQRPPDELVTLASSNRDGSSAAWYAGFVVGYIHCCAFWTDDIIPGKYICSQAIDEMEPSTEADYYSPTLIACCGEIKRLNQILIGLMLRCSDTSKFNGVAIFIIFTAGSWLVSQSWPISIASNPVSIQQL